MSQVKITGNASGTGVLTIAAPNTNTDRTISLPDKAGAIAVGAGTIVQVVQASSSTQVTNATTSYVDSGISASIAPTSSSNKIFVNLTVQVRIARSNDQAGGGLKVLRDSTEIYTPIANTTGPFHPFIDVGTGSQATLYATMPIFIVDSPATTSSVTYKVQHRPYLTTNSGNMSINFNSTDGDQISYIQLLEVVAWLQK